VSHLNHPFPTYQILECVDPGEYSALSAENKEFLHVLLSCGILDLEGDTKAHGLLFAIFAAGPITIAALQHLLQEA
jgi:hypothetical protein